jgi:hypothetical protein
MKAGERRRWQTAHGTGKGGWRQTQAGGDRSPSLRRRQTEETLQVKAKAVGEAREEVSRRQTEAGGGGARPTGEGVAGRIRLTPPLQAEANKGG